MKGELDMVIAGKVERRMKGVDRVLGGEEAIDAVSGHVDGKCIGSKDDKVSGVLVLTPSRLVFYHKNLLGGHVSEEYPLSRISTITLDSGFMKGAIKVTASGNNLILHTGITDQSSADFVNRVKAQMNNGHAPITSPQVEKPVDIADQIKKLADLRDQGILTEDEFTAKKQQLLGL